MSDWSVGGTVTRAVSAAGKSLLEASLYLLLIKKRNMQNLAREKC